MREEIAQQGIGDAAQAFRPGAQTMVAVNADAQNLGLDPFEPFQSDLVRRDLAGSYRCPGQGEERQDHIAAPAEIAQAHPRILVAF
jgi:hypothetical protein